MSKEKIQNLKERYHKLQNRVENERDEINIAKGKLAEITQQIDTEVENRDQLQEQNMLYEKSTLFLSTFLEKEQNLIEDSFSKIGSSALHKVFGEDKELLFTFDKAKKKNPSVNIEIRQPWDDGEELVTDLLEAEGGAMIDIIAVGLRLAMIKLVSPEQKGPIFFDEICRYIAKNESIRSMGEFLYEVAHKMDKQLIVISHTPELFQYADKLITFEAGNKKSVVIKEQYPNAEA